MLSATVSAGLCLDLGPFRLGAESGGLELGFPPRERAYADFLSPAPGTHPEGIDFLLEVSAGPLPELDLDGLEVLGRSRGQWWLARDREGRLLLPFCIPAGAPRLARLLVPEADFRRGRLHIDPSREAGPFNPFGNLLSELLVTCLLETRPGLLLHAAAVVDRGRAWLFPGASGVGKTTLAKLWRDAGRSDGGADIQVLGDESVLLTIDGDAITIHGTPWHSAEPLYANVSAPLEGVFFPEHGREHALRPLSRSEALCGLLANAFAPLWSERGAGNALAAAARAVEAAPCARLAFRPEPEIVEFLRART